MAFLRDSIRSAIADWEVAEGAKETLALLSDMATQKTNYWSPRLASELKSGKRNTIDDNYIPISRVIGEVKQTRAITQESMPRVVDETAAALGSMIGRKIPVLDGVGMIVHNALTEILREGEGCELEVTTYAVVSEGDAIVRYDFAFWGRNISTRTLRRYMESVFACVAIKSSVDCTKMDHRTFLTVIAPALRGAYPSDEEQKKKLRKAEETFKACGGLAQPQAVEAWTDDDDIHEAVLLHSPDPGVRVETPST